MSRFFKLAMGSFALISILSLASCSHETPFAGTWKATAPTDVTSDFPGCRNAMSTITLSFAQDANNTDGTVQLTDRMSIVRPLVLSDRPGGEAAYANIDGVGTINGKWSRDVDDADDILLALDYSTLSVNIDPGSISFTGIDAASVSAERKDSIAEAVKTEMGIYLRSKLSRFDVLSDMEVDKDRKNLEFEIHSPETEFWLVNVDK